MDELIEWGICPTAMLIYPPRKQQDAIKELKRIRAHKKKRGVKREGRRLAKNAKENNN